MYNVRGNTYETKKYQYRTNINHTFGEFSLRSSGGFSIVGNITLPSGYWIDADTESENVKNPPANPGTGYAISYFVSNFSTYVASFFNIDGDKFIGDFNADGNSIYGLDNTTSDGVYTDTLGSKGGAGITLADSMNASDYDLYGGDDINFTRVYANGTRLLKNYDCTVDISGKGDYTTIQGCDNALSDGGSVYIKTGTYSGSVSGGNNMDYTGAGYSTIITGGTFQMGNSSHIQKVKFKSVTFKGGDNSSVTNSMFVKAYPYAAKVDNWIVDNNIIFAPKDYYCGFFSNDVKYSHYTNNICQCGTYDGLRGIYVLHASHNTINDNTFYNCSACGVLVTGGSSHNTINDNKFVKGGYHGIIVDVVNDPSYFDDYGNIAYNQIGGNSFYDMDSSGIMLRQTDTIGSGLKSKVWGTSITDNMFYSCGNDGISITTRNVSHTLQHSDLIQKI